MMRTTLVRVRDLPRETLPERTGTHVMLVCAEGCDGEYSACQGDYFLLEGSHVLRCECGAPMRLVNKVTRYQEVRS